ncbi:MAG: hypothetical protein C4567_10710 [Deltaproteobacteria bacterium]|nr:MAG: hypothetical protein C4567_10710 [Deltaproteobacteria bacterium]
MGNDGKFKTLANLATSVSALAAAVMVFITAYNFNQQAEKERIMTWQAPLIYGAIREKPGISFQEIKNIYLTSASQKTYPVPIKALQDDELNKVILNLLSNKVILLYPEGKYYPAISSPNLINAEEKIIKELEYRNIVNCGYERILTIIELESGTYNAKSIHQKLLNEGFKISLENVNALIGELRMKNLVKIKAKDRTIFATHDIK